MQEKARLEFPGHEKAIAIMEQARQGLESLGYRAELVKLESREENLPSYSSVHFSLRLQAAKVFFPNQSGIGETCTRYWQEADRLPAQPQS